MKKNIVTYLAVAGLSGTISFLLGVQFARRPEIDPRTIPHGPDKNFRTLQHLAEGGNREAQRILGLAYDAGTFWSVAVDEKKAEYWYLQAAKQWVPDASYSLMVKNDVYTNGVFSHETREGFVWGFVSALQGNPHARGWLGIKYLKGDLFVPKDLPLAHAWLALAHYQGDEFVTKRLTDLETELNVKDREEAATLAIWLVRNFGRGKPLIVGTGSHGEHSLDLSKWHEAPPELRDAEQRESPTTP